MIKYTKDSIAHWAELGPRSTVGEAAALLASNDPALMLMYADCGKRICADYFRERFPEQCLDVGIAEHNLVTVAAGMASEGLNVFTATYATFMTARVMDQIRVNLGYMKLPVKTIGLGAGLASGDLGATHTALEDLANMRGIPGVVVVSPADATEVVKAMEAVSGLDLPAYLRITIGSAGERIYDDDYDFEIGRAITLRKGDDVALIACGTVLRQTLDAAEVLNGMGVSCQVLNMHTIKPLDTQAIAEQLDKKLIVTVEEHSILGGLGSAVAEFLAEIPKHPPLIRLGIPDAYYYADLPQNLMAHAGLTAEKIAESVQKAIKADLK